MEKIVKNLLITSAVVILSVIAGLVILGLLMGTPSPIASITGTPDEIMERQISLIQGKYSSGTVPLRVTFENDKIYEIRQIIQNVNLNNSVVEFAYTEEFLNFIEDANATEFKVSKRFDGIVVACSNPDIYKYVIALGAKGEEKATSTLCREKRDE